VRHTANYVPNTAHILQFTLFELWARSYTMQLQLHIFRIQYSTKRSPAGIGDMSTIQWALYCNLCAIYSTYSPDYVTWTVVPDIHHVFTAPHIEAPIFNWKILRCCRRYVENSVSLILQTWCQIKRTTSRLRNVVCGLGHIKYIYSSTYSGFNFQFNVSPPLLEIYRQFSVRYTANMVLIQRTTSRLHNVNCGPGHIHCK
jgi:hypothetical protein